MSAPSILVVDDVSSVRALVRQLIAPMGAKITEAANGCQALDLALTNHFDLIITDYQMPKMDGVSLCRELKDNAITQGLPVIMLSDFTSPEDINRGFEAGANAYIAKADSQERLLAMVEKIIKKSRFKNNQLILIVDDDRTIRKLLVRTLSRSGFKTIAVENGLKALQSISRNIPDLILSDISMPEMDGFELCRAVKADSAFSSIPFMVMSGNSDRAHMIRMMHQGAASYIIKPFNFNELVILIERLLSDQYLLLLKDREMLAREQDYFLASISSLVSALEARDAYTKGHSESVADIVTGMLALTGASTKELDRINTGARLHDIGKIGIRDNVLLKSGRLTTEEFDHIKRHPTIGTKILQTIPSLADIIPIVQHHHERWDGKGYPSSLKGEEIHLWARILAVADTFDAMTSDRPYRKGMPNAKAQQIIADVSGSQFCPDCVDLFMQWLAQPGPETS